MSPRAHRGKKLSFWSSLPNIRTGCGTPMDWCADSIAPMAGHADPTRVSARL